MVMDSPIRVLVAKPGLDGHDRGAQVVAMALRDAGMEVIYTGLRATVDTIVETAVDEDVDVIGLSVLSGAHEGLTRKVITQLRVVGKSDCAVVVGGTIPPVDVPHLQALGADGVFPTGTPLLEIVNSIRAIVRERRKKRTVK